MPNTLCHIGIQAPLNGLVFPPVAIIWVVIACVLPDLPWIWLKVLLKLKLFDPYDLRLYCTAQASFIFCLFLSAALSFLSKYSGKVFLILGVNCLLHLLLDSLQIKWGNGVHLISPVSWEFFHLELFWPEHLATLVFTLVGCIYLIIRWGKIVDDNPLEPVFQPLRLSLILLFLSLYTLGPLYFIDQMNRADVYYVDTMRKVEERTGKTIQLDRAHYQAENHQVRAWSGEKIALTGELPETSGRLSVKGEFINNSTIQVSSFHLHRDKRDFASLLGLIMACTLVVHSLVLARFRRIKKH